MPEPSQPTATQPPPAGDMPPVQNIDDVYGEFDSTEASASKKESAQQRPPSGTPTKSEGAVSSAKSADKKDATASDGKVKSTVPDASTKPDTESSQPKPVKAAELRTAYENLKSEHRSLKAEFEKLKAKPADDARVKQLQELLDSERKARAEIEQELKFTAYEKSQEFKDKFQKPYMEAYKMGRQKAASLKSTNEAGEVRQGTEADFDSLMRIEDDDLATDKAVELFGNKAQMVLYYRERVQELHNSSRAAIEEYRGSAEKREKEQSEALTRQEAEREQQSKAAAELFHKAVEEGKKSRPELFTPPEGDEAAAELIKRGESVADSLFTRVNPKTGRPYTPDGLIKFHAFVRNAIASHGHLMHKLKAAETRMAELESDLAEYKKSGTSEDSGRAGEKPTGTGLAGDEEFDAAESKSGRRW